MAQPNLVVEDVISEIASGGWLDVLAARDEFVAADPTVELKRPCRGA